MTPPIKWLMWASDSDAIHLLTIGVVRFAITPAGTASVMTIRLAATFGHLIFSAGFAAGKSIQALQRSQTQHLAASF